MNVNMRDMSWLQIAPFANPSTIVIVPTAAIEQHGRHLPLDVDCCIVESVAIRSAERVRSEVPILVAPTISYGVSGYHMRFPGSVTLSMETFITVVQEVCISLIHHGFRRILLLNGHGGNDDPLKIATRNIADITGIAVASASYWNIAASGLAEFQGSEVDAIPGHACGFETACMMALRPEHVNSDAMIAISDEAAMPEYARKNLESKVAKVQLPKQADVRGDHGWRGDPTKGSKENGEKYLEIIEGQLAEFLVQFSHHSQYEAPEGFSHERVIGGMHITG
jgi:creatinine amidohydrolase